jgi:hypothetical protein
MHRCLFLAIQLLVVTSALAQQPPPLSPAEKQAALATIQKWRGFEGTWEGEVRYVSAPKEEWYKLRVPFRVTIKNNEPKVFTRDGPRAWVELGATYRLHQPDPLTLLIHAYGADGVWTENNVVVLTRRAEDAADIYVQRVVNNWAGKPLPGQDLVYGDTRTGKVTRQ